MSTTATHRWPSPSRQPFLQTTPIARRRRDREFVYHALVGIQRNYIARPFQHGPALLARKKMRVHRRAQPGIDVALNVVRDLLPHLFAVHCVLIVLVVVGIHHGLFPFSNGKRLNQPCSHPAASRSRNIKRARNSRVFTDATEIPSASAVS